DSGRAQPEEVTVAMLRSAVRRTIDGVTTMVDLRLGARPPRLQPGPTCRWCSLRTTCTEGLAELARQEDVDDDGW
ncbi:MAG TPA: hypothetical protein VF076_08635, partial [Acidimicrobiales bacterium]